LNTTLYRLYSKTRVLLYVGVSQNPRFRLTQHRADKPWWSLVEWYRFEEFSDRTDALIAEERAIKTEWPLCNRQAHPSTEWVRVATLEPRILTLAEEMASQGQDLPDRLSDIKWLVGWYA
jgi:predicted GIY-YIG superfamily endonuclease